MAEQPDGSLERPLPCESLLVSETQGGSLGCGIVFYILFALCFGGMPLILLLQDNAFIARSERVQAVVVAPGWFEERRPDGEVKRKFYEGRRIVEFTAADGQVRRRELPGKGALNSGERFEIWWSGRGRGQVADIERLEGQRPLFFVFMGVAVLMLWHVVALIRRWRRDSERCLRLRKLGRRTAAVDWKIRYYRSGKFDRYRVQLKFQGPDGRWYMQESDEYRQSPEERMAECRPAVWLDPADPRSSIVAMDSLPPTESWPVGRGRSSDAAGK